MPEIINGVDMVLLGQFRQHAHITLPDAQLAVNEQQGRAVIGAFGLVDGAAVESDIFLDKASLINSGQVGLSEVQAVTADGEEPDHAKHSEGEQPPQQYAPEAAFAGLICFFVGGLCRHDLASSVSDQYWHRGGVYPIGEVMRMQENMVRK